MVQGIENTLFAVEMLNEKTMVRTGHALFWIWGTG